MKYFKQNGFTLIELLVAIAVSGIVSTTIIGFFISQQRSHIAQEQVTFMQQNIRAGLGVMSRDLRMAGYNPTKSAATAGFLSGLENPGDPDSNLLGLSNITIRSDIDGDGDATSVGEEVKFTLDGSDLKRNDIILAEDISAVAFAFAYDADADGQLDTDGGDIIFAIAGPLGESTLDGTSTWYRIDDAGVTTDTTTSALAADIRAVKIWLLAKTPHPDPNFSVAANYTVGNQTIAANAQNRYRLLDTVVSCRNMGL